MNFLPSGMSGAAQGLLGNDFSSRDTQSSQFDANGQNLPAASLDQMIDAIGQGDVASFKALVKMYDGNPMEKNIEGRTLLHAAANSSCVDFVDILLAHHGENLDFKLLDIDGKTALDVAFEKENFGVLDVMLGKVAEEKPGGYTMDVARKYGHLGMVLAAAKVGHFIAEDDILSAMKKMLQRSSGNVNARDSDGKTTLMLAAEKGFKRAAEFLLCNGADLHLLDKQGCNAVAYAMKNESLDMLGILGPAKMDDLFNAILRRDVPAFRMLLERLDGSSINEICTTGSTFRNKNLLQTAVNSKHEGLVEALVNSRHRNILELESTDSFGFTVLRSAVFHGCGHKIVRLLVDAGANINAVQGNGNNVLSDLFWRHPVDIEVLEVLIEAGVDLDMPTGSTESSILFNAIGLQDFRIIKRLIDAGAKAKITNNFGFTPMMYSISCRNNVKILEFLLDIYMKSGGDINACTQDGRTALAVACEKKNSAAVEILLRTAKQDGNISVIFNAWKIGISVSEEHILATCTMALEKEDGDINARDEDESTLLIKSVNRKLDSVVALLLQNKRNIDINAKDNLGRTAVMHAALNGDLEKLEALRLAGADLYATDNQGANAGLLATNAGHLDAMAFFMARGALF